MKKLLAFMAFIVGAVVSFFLIVTSLKKIQGMAEDSVSGNIQRKNAEVNREVYNRLVEVKKEEIVSMNVDAVMQAWQKRFGVKK